MSNFEQIRTIRHVLLTIFAVTTFNSYSQKLKIITLQKSQTIATLLGSASNFQLLTQFNGQQNNAFRKKWTARTFILSDGRAVIEFFDRSAALINNIEQLQDLEQVRFVKNSIDFLKKNVSYKIQLTHEKGRQIIESESPKRLTQYKSDLPQWFGFEVYELNTGQILFLDNSENAKAATIYPDIKTLSSENTSVLETAYGSEDDEHLMKKLAAGDRLADYDINEHVIYPEYLNDLIKNHKLTRINRRIYVSRFFGNLYKSDGGYYILVDEVRQRNGAGRRMAILGVRFYATMEQVRVAQSAYKTFKKEGGSWEHSYANLSGKYGDKFPVFIPQLIDALPQILNFDKEQLSFDSAGIDLVDEVLKWNATNYKLFDHWFPSVLAYYGQCYIALKKEGKWSLQFDEESQTWIPVVELNDGSYAWDPFDFNKSLYEGPVPLRGAGD